MSKIYGITGSIATGKSYVAQIITDLGYQVYDADEIAHEVGNFPEVLTKLSEIFGSKIIDNKKLNRKELGNIVFNDSNMLSKLNEIMGPVIKKRLLEIISDVHTSSSKKIEFIEIPLLFEENYEGYLDGTILVYADSTTQLKRLMDRDKIDEKFAKAKISKQLSINIKKAKSDYIIDNSNDSIQVDFQVQNLLSEIQ